MGLRPPASSFSPIVSGPPLFGKIQASSANRSARQRTHGNSISYHHRCPRTLRPYPRTPNHGQHRHQPAPPFCNHGHGRVHRMTELFARLAPGVTLSKLAPSCAPLRGYDQSTSRSLFGQADFQISASVFVTSSPPVLAAFFSSARRLRAHLHHCLLQCRQPDSHTHRSPRRRAGHTCRAGRNHRRTAPHAAGREPSSLRRRRRARCNERAAHGRHPGRYASRFSVRAVDLTVDNSMLWVGAALAIVAAIILAFVPRLPSAETSNGLGLSSGSVRITSSTNRRQRISLSHKSPHPSCSWPAQLC